MEKHDPLVSIITLCYNHAKYLHDYFQSLLNQSYKNIELIIINDCSKDNSKEIIETFLPILNKEFVNVMFIDRKINKGIVSNCNEALFLAKGKYFILSPSDDLMINTRIEKNVSYLESKGEDFGMVHSDAIKFWEAAKSNSLKGIRVNNINIPDGEDQYFKRLLKGNIITASTTCIRTNVLKEVGGFSEKYIHEDYYLWLKISKNYKIGYINEPLVGYRQHNNSFSATNSLVNKMVEHNLDILKEFKEEVDLEYYNLCVESHKLNALILYYKTSQVELFKKSYSEIENKSLVYKILKILVSTRLNKFLFIKKLSYAKRMILNRSTIINLRLDSKG